MKNIADLETRLLEELTAWFPEQCQKPYEDFYLYYWPTTPDHNGGIIIIGGGSTPHSTEYQLAMPERINKGDTVEQNFNRIRLGILRTLPVLSA